MISDPEELAVTLLAQLIERRIGLHYAVRDRPILAGKLRDHADAEGFDSLLDFYRSVEYDDLGGERLNTLVDVLIVGETYFLRERPGLERVVEIVQERRSRHLSTRIWSAACATGEEILSLAAMLAEQNLLEDVRLVASDVSDRQLARARKGHHTLRSLRLLPDGMPPWIRAQDGVAVVDPRLTQRVDWRKVNLIDSAAVAALGPFDVILCRNVLIYFDDAMVVRVAETLADALVPGGTLLIGTSESLLRFATSLRCVESRGTFLYRRHENAR
ncbi:MAG: CheR family methyltransferase [Myxococcota bacterium]